LAQPPYDNHLCVGGWIMAHLPFVETNCCDLAITNEDRAYTLAAWSSLTLARSFYRQFHKSYILFARHLASNCGY
jgi:hypothetical protein